MRIAMIGTGYVGLVSGVCFSDFGHDVVCVDKDAAKIARLNAGEVPIYEPGLDELLARNTAAGRLSFTTELGEALQGAEAVFIAVGTPTRRGDGHADLTYVYAAAEEIAQTLTGPAVVVVKSTVPVGTNREVARRIAEVNSDAEIEIASNPEFLREGAAIEDFMRPDRVVVGAETPRAEQVMRDIYRPLNIRETPIVVTDLESAEMIKYAANAFLATKITFINEVADLCEKTGANVQSVAKGIGLDGRIGNKFLHAGPGYGGSCFPKDTSALARIGQEHSTPLRIVETVMGVNDARKRAMVEKIKLAMDDKLAGQRIAVFGVTFKPNTDDMRDSPFADHRAGADRGGRGSACLRSRGREGGRGAAARDGLDRRSLCLCGGGRRDRGADRVEPVPWARPGAAGPGHARQGAGRPAQYLRPAGGRGGRADLYRRRAVTPDFANW